MGSKDKKARKGHEGPCFCGCGCVPFAKNKKGE